MFFRNLTFLRFPVNFSGFFQTSVTDALQDIGAELGECRLKPVGPLELHSRGFISPFGRDCEELSHRLGDCIWIAIGGEDKLLPAAVVNDLLFKKLDEIERVEGRKPGGRTRKRIKDELVTELLPKAFVSPSRVDAYLDLARGFIVVDTSSRRTAENVVSEVRRAAGMFPALPVNAEVSPRSVLTGWLAGEPLPEGLALGDECELRDPISDGGVVRIQREELLSDEVAKHLESGKQCTRLALVYSDHVSFVLGEDLTIRKLKFLDGAVDALENAEREDLRAELDARFALMIGEIGLLFDMLERALKITRAESDAPGPASASPTPPKPARTRGQLHGVSTVTITAGGESVTMTGEQFANLGETVEQFEKAVAIVRKSGNAGISHLQRQLRIGYNRAARLIEAMEARGFVSPPNHSGERTVLAAKENA